MSATNRGAIRSKADFYPTPEWCVRRLLERLMLPVGLWLEPAAGDGAILRAVDKWSTRKIDQWTAMDLRPETEPFLRQLTDDVWIGDSIATLKALDACRRWDVIITNPPFTLAEEFVRAALPRSEFVVVLLRLNWLGSEDRHPFLVEHMPDVYVLPNRPSFVGDGTTDATEYAWMVWREGRQRAAHIKVLGLTSSEERNADPRQMPLFDDSAAKRQIAMNLECP